MVHIEQISPIDAEHLCRAITKDLPEYFGLPECNETYAQGLKEHTNFAIRHQGSFVGLLSLAFPYSQSAQIYWMGILKQYQGQGLGQLLIQKAACFALSKKAQFLTVETLSKKACDENYLKTYRFYEKMGFVPLFDLKPEGYEWLMVYMALELASFQSFSLNNPSTIQSLRNAPHFDWGDGWEGWWLKENNALCVISERMPPNTTEKRHYHQKSEQFFYCLSGQLSIELEDQHYTLHAHESLTIAPGQKHKVRNISNEVSTFLVVSTSYSREDRFDLE